MNCLLQKATIISDACSGVFSLAYPTVALRLTLGHNAQQKQPHIPLAHDCMYYQYFGLNEAPFSIAVNPRYLFMSARHRDALAHLLYGVGTGGGFILLTGEVGTGKTTINRCLLEQLPHDTDIAIILNPALNAMELLASACDELGIEYNPDNHTLKTLTDKLHTFLLDNHARGRKTVLLIDEAQHLDFDVLEQIRLLTNLETNSEKLLQIILIGQPELAQMLARPELRQLNQRITARYNLEPLNLDETGAYIHHRLQVAGMSPERIIFPDSIVRGIHKHTRGIPRVINVLCDRVLLGAYGRNKTSADRSMLKLAVEEVLGEPGGKPSSWRWPLAAAMVLLAVVLGWWQLTEHRSVENRQLQRPAAPVQQQLPVAEPFTESVTVTELPQELVAADTVKLPIVEASRQSAAPGDHTMAAAMLPPGWAMTYLWPLYSSAPAPQETCPEVVHAGVACVASEAQTWDELAIFDRPLLLHIVTPQRFAAQVLLLGIDGATASVLTKEGVATLALAELAPLWTGLYSFLWHPPAGFERALALGDSSPVVGEVAQLFARLDGRQRPLADRRFSSGLQQRVRLFQQQHGLDDDGVVGVRTLLKLNEQLGIDVTASAARRQLQLSLAPSPSPSVQESATL